MTDILARLDALAAHGRPTAAMLPAIRDAADEIRDLRAALHAAIAAPRGVVPDAALPFYDPKHPALRRT